MKKTTILLITLFLLTAVSGWSDTDISGSWEVAHVGVYGNSAYFKVKNYTFYKENSTEQVTWGLIYIDLTTIGGRALYTQVLTAQAAKLRITRIIYGENSSGASFASLIRISDSE